MSDEPVEVPQEPVVEGPRAEDVPQAGVYRVAREGMSKKTGEQVVQIDGADVVVPIFKRLAVGDLIELSSLAAQTYVPEGWVDPDPVPAEEGVPE